MVKTCAANWLLYYREITFFYIFDLYFSPSRRRGGTEKLVRSETLFTILNFSVHRNKSGPEVQYMRTNLAQRASKSGLNWTEGPVC